jgi:hypothetical protein
MYKVSVRDANNNIAKPQCSEDCAAYARGDCEMSDGPFEVLEDIDMYIREVHDSLFTEFEEATGKDLEGFTSAITSLDQLDGVEAPELFECALFYGASIIRKIEPDKGLIMLTVMSGFLSGHIDDDTAMIAVRHMINYLERATDATEWGFVARAWSRVITSMKAGYGANFVVERI